MQIINPHYGGIIARELVVEDINSYATIYTGNREIGQVSIQPFNDLGAVPSSADLVNAPVWTDVLEITGAAVIHSNGTWGAVATINISASDVIDGMALRARILIDGNVAADATLAVEGSINFRGMLSGAYDGVSTLACRQNFKLQMARNANDPTANGGYVKHHELSVYATE